jgi:hypothetical protein
MTIVIDKRVTLPASSDQYFNLYLVNGKLVSHGYPTERAANEQASFERIACIHVLTGAKYGN